ncbi:MAG: hypothetical protein Q4F95_14045 [Oscillospiraceae bacterium]|nr:hypothetical protein [Oscillospiraceae bacterium]
MKKTQSKILAASLICLLSFSMTACKNDKIKDNSTVVVTQDTSVTSENDNSAASTEAAIPEKDADGSKIVTVTVTDTDKKPVTQSGGAASTQLAIVDKDNNVITDTKGNNVKPNLPTVTTSAGGVIVTTKETQKDAAQNIQTSADGPTLSIDQKIEASAGQEVTFQIKVTKNTGYSGLIAWLDIDKRYFDIIDYKGGDPSDPDYKMSDQKNNMSISVYNKPNKSDIDTLVFFYYDQSLAQVTEDNTYATVTLKVKDSVPAGEYPLEFDSVADGKVLCNSIADDKSIIESTPKYINGSIVVK